VTQEIGWRITVVTEDTRETEFLFQRLSMALQRGNAVSFQNTIITEWNVVAAIYFVQRFCASGPKNNSLYIYINRTLCLFDRLRVGMPNGRNAERLDWQPYHTTKWWLAVCRPCSIAATCCHFRWSEFRPVGIKTVPDRMRECWHNARVGIPIRSRSNRASDFYI